MLYPQIVLLPEWLLQPRKTSENPEERHRPDWRADMSRKDDLDNHSNQLNPNNDAYWESRDWDDRPDDWEGRAESGDTLPDDDN